MGGIARLYRTGRACCSWTLRETLPPLGRPMRHVSGAAAQQEVVAVSLNEEGTVRLGQELSRTLRAGDVYLIRGKVGAGKSALARAFIRCSNESRSTA